MKICITAQGNTLASQVDARFGRCTWFIILDTETRQFEAVDNAHAGSTGGAGIQSGQLMSEKGVKALLTGNVGPNAFQTLQAAGIEVITGVAGTVEQVIEKYNKGEYRPAGAATVDSHFGMKGGN